MPLSLIENVPSLYDFQHSYKNTIPLKTKIKDGLLAGTITFISIGLLLLALLASGNQGLTLSGVIVLGIFILLPLTLLAALANANSAYQKQARRSYLKLFETKIHMTFYEKGDASNYIPPQHPFSKRGRAIEGFARSDKALGLMNIGVWSPGNKTMDEYAVGWLYLPDLPVDALSLIKRNILNSPVFDRLDSSFTPSRVIELESSAFHTQYKLQVADQTDELEIRKAFSPQLIDQILDKGIVMQNVPGAPNYSIFKEISSDSIHYHNNYLWIIMSRECEFTDMHEVNNCIHVINQQYQLIHQLFGEKAYMNLSSK